MARGRRHLVRGLRRHKRSHTKGKGGDGTRGSREVSRDRRRGRARWRFPPPSELGFDDRGGSRGTPAGDPRGTSREDQLTSFDDGAERASALAEALGRTCWSCPRARCYCDKIWNNLNACRAPGAETFVAAVRVPDGPHLRLPRGSTTSGAASCRTFASRVFYPTRGCRRRCARREADRRRPRGGRARGVPGVE